MKKRPVGRFSFFVKFACAGRRRRCGHAAFNHMAVSKALLIIGMFMPKLGLLAFFETGLGGFPAAFWAVSIARSHDPCSWERATEKNRNT